MKQFLAILSVFVFLTAFTYNNTPATDGSTLPSIDVKTLDG